MSTQYFGYGSFDEYYGEGEPAPEAPEPAFFVADDDGDALRNRRAEDEADAHQVRILTDYLEKHAND